jgi:hypothetical protein
MYTVCLRRGAGSVLMSGWPLGWMTVIGKIPYTRASALPGPQSVLLSATEVASKEGSRVRRKMGQATLTSPSSGPPRHSNFSRQCAS